MEAAMVDRTEKIVHRLNELADAAPEVAIERDRYGYRIDGEFYRRVTTQLRGIPKPWLANWAAKMVAEFAVEHREQWEALGKTDAVKLLKGSPWSKRDDAGDRGTAIHNTIEAYVKDEPEPDGLTEDEAACAARAKAFLEARPSRVLASELTVYHTGHGYAGTLDLWDVTDEGVLTILDWKTSSGIYPEHAVQQVAYRNAEFAVVRKRVVTGAKEKWVGKRVPWGPKMADRLGIVHVTPEDAILYPINPAHYDHLWRVFLASAFVKGFTADVDDYAGKTPRLKLYEEPISLNGEAA